MLILLLFSFLAGVITILSPCIFPVLPIILASSANGSKRHAWGVVGGFILSFTFFTLFLSALVRATGVSPDFVRHVAVFVIAGFGFVLLVPRLQLAFEGIASRMASWAGGSKKVDSGLWGGILVGLSLGLIWTPCVGPILASVIALALTGSVSGEAFFITLAYALGTAIPMLLILLGGRQIFVKVPSLARNLGTIQKAFAVLMVLTAVGLFFNLDRQFQTYFLEKFPAYGAGLTKIEDNSLVRQQLNGMNEMPSGVELAPELIPGGEWFNSDPLTLESLRGKVVLVDFWTYSCINCIRTLPYLKAWHEKYADDGLVIIGVHAPEFEFEKNPENLRKAIEDFGLKYPIVQDNDFATWTAYNNRYWPAKYFIDAEGVIRDSHFGEGDYEESELLIQSLLKEAGFSPKENLGGTAEYSVDANTPETYLGSARSGGLKPVSEFPEELELNQLALQGSWTIEEEKAAPARDARLRFHFDAKDVYLVMNPVDATPGQVEVFLDGVSQGVVTVDSDKLYTLLELDEAGDHLLELHFLDSNVETFAFTFG